MPTAALDIPSLEERASWVVRSSPPDASFEVPVGAKTTYLTHGLFRYAGKLPPPLVAFLLNRHAESGALVVDPMCGGGTTAIEAVSSGLPVLSCDVNPVSRLVTEAVSTPADVEGLVAFAEKVVDQHEEREPTAELAEYFSPAAYGLLDSGLELAGSAAEKVLMLSIARPASFANTKKINTVVDPAKVPKDPVRLLVDASRRFAASFDQLNATDPAASEVRPALATDVPLADDAADFVLLHPPYLTNTAFSESMHLQLLLVGEKPKALRKTELAYRGSYFHVPNGLHKYLLGWAKILAEADRTVRPGGRIAIVIGDGRIDKIRIPVAAITKEFGADLGLQLIEQATHRLNNQTGLTLSRRMTSQHVLVFESR